MVEKYGFNNDNTIKDNSSELDVTIPNSGQRRFNEKLHGLGKIRREGPESEILSFDF